MTDTVVRYQDEPLLPGKPANVTPQGAEMHEMMRLCDNLAKTDFVPEAIRGNPPAVLAAVLSGREMGLGPMRALRQINVIDGKPSPEPELMVALALSAGHTVRVVETTHERCTVRVKRREWDAGDYQELTWTLDDAVRAGLCEIRDGRAHARSYKGKPTSWEKYPRAMLRARVTSEACRAWLPDVVEGASYTPGELAGADYRHDPQQAARALDGAPADVQSAVQHASTPPAAATADTQQHDEPAADVPSSNGTTAAAVSDPGPDAEPWADQQRPGADPERRRVVSAIISTSAQLVSRDSEYSAEKHAKTVAYAQSPDHPLSTLSDYLRRMEARLSVVDAGTTDAGQAAGNGQTTQDTPPAEDTPAAEGAPEDVAAGEQVNWTRLAHDTDGVDQVSLLHNARRIAQELNDAGQHDGNGRQFRIPGKLDKIPTNLSNPLAFQLHGWVDEAREAAEAANKDAESVPF